MKKITFWLFAFIFCAMTWQMNAQVFVYENFDSGTPSGWSNSYTNTSTQACSGNSQRRNLYSWSTTADLTSPNYVGASNETDLGFSFDYKIVNYSDQTVATSAGWGTAEFQYSLDDGANWTTVFTINDDNHIVSNECANMGGVIPAASLPEGSDVKLRIYNVWATGDYYFYVDNFFASQEIVLPPNCDAGLAFPADGAVNAPTTGDISWDVATGAPLGYSLTVGTTSGGSEVFSGDVGNVTSYSLGTLDPATLYYVSIVPYNDNGDATECSEYSFTTVAMPTCTANLVATPDPECGNIGSTSLTWDALDIADGYYLNLGTTPGGTDVYNNEDLGDVTMYSVPGDLQDAGITYYWTILPYNTAGSAVDCAEETYTTSENLCYCTSVPTSVDGQGITNVLLGDTDFPITYEADGAFYEDLTGAPVDVYTSINTVLELTISTGTYNYGAFVWIDYNDDSDFDDDGELVFTPDDTPMSNSFLDLSFTIPADAVLGEHRMRIIMDWNGNQTEGPCYSGSYGHSVDVDINIMESTCTPGVAEGSLIEDCDNSQFFVDVEVTEVGDIIELTDGTTTLSVTETGVFSFGPYDDASEATISAVHSDAVCDFEVGTFTNTCPIPGQICETAIPITALPYDTNDSTANYFDDYSGSPGNCNSSSYLNGDDVFYQYDAVADSNLLISLYDLSDNYAGLFVYTSCEDIGTNCIASVSNGWGSGDLSFELEVTEGTSYYFVISTWASPQSTEYGFSIIEYNCVQGVAEATVDSDCDNDQFYIDVEVSEVGDMIQLNDGTTTLDVTAAGTYTFGPYVNGSEITVSGVHADSSCDFVVGTVAYSCPIPGQICETAIEIVELPYLTSDDTANYFDDYENGSSSCSSYYMSGDDVVYSFTPDTDDVYTITLSNLGSTWSGLHVLDGCPNTDPTCVGFAGSSNSDDRIVEVELFAGSTYYIIVSTWASPQSTTYDLSIETESLSVQDVTMDNLFEFYPNPVSETLNIKAKQVVEKVEVYNTLGQIVLTNLPNNTNPVLNMNQLKSGTYFVKVSINGLTETIRIVKK
ncbi:GEVED domain-containing protein [Mangrovimonas sp. ST2L15]|uniref:GEVED domain-containing protein n=1 Tax=Mangrovimonas sp. ST2L15 TaxID=1645916 RepID=UPI0006B43244|nr:GEVED domain-containing protein [Mangrovimonas sp. ST2L15]